MEHRIDDGSGNETRIYERALEISKARLTDLTWNNILYEANLDVKTAEAEENKVSDEVVQLQLQIQELQTQNVELVEVKNEFEEKNSQITIDYARLQKLDDLNDTLRKKIEILQERVEGLGDSDLVELNRKSAQLPVVEIERDQIKIKLNEALEKLSTSDGTTNILINEKKELEQELELLRPKVKQLESVASKGQSSSDAYSDLEQEFLRREQRHNEMQQKHNITAEELIQARKEKQDVDSALATQKKLYTELLQRMESKEQEHILELEKLKPTPKKRGRPKKTDVQDGGLLDSATV